MLKRKSIVPIVLLVSLFLLSCATTQAPIKVIPDTARIVRLYVPSCT
jgi:hypothetical protein